MRRGEAGDYRRTRVRCFLGVTFTRASALFVEALLASTGLKIAGSSPPLLQPGSTESTNPAAIASDIRRMKITLRMRHMPWPAGADSSEDANFMRGFA